MLPKLRHEIIGNHSIPVTSYRWAMKNVPVLTDEGFTYSLKNHIARIELQLSAVTYPLIPRSFNTGWEAIVAGLLKSEGFGEHLKASNSWMAEDIKPNITSGETDLETAKAIYYYIKDNFKCTSIKIWLDEDGKSYVEYKCNRSGKILSFLSRIKAGKVYFSPHEYPDFREFYNHIFKKQHEQIVIKKIGVVVTKSRLSGHPVIFRYE